MEAKQIIENIDWSELRDQKKILLNISTETNEEKDGIEGILSLIDQLQDYACDVMNIPSVHVYDFETEDDEDDTNPDKISPNIVNKFGVDDSNEEPEPKIIAYSINDIDWTLEEMNMISSLINRFGDGQHPVCDDKSFMFFNKEYLIEILNENRVAILSGLSPMGLELVSEIKIKLKII